MVTEERAAVSVVKNPRELRPVFPPARAWIDGSPGIAGNPFSYRDTVFGQDIRVFVRNRFDLMGELNSRRPGSFCCEVLILPSTKIKFDFCVYVVN